MTESSDQQLTELFAGGPAFPVPHPQRRPLVEHLARALGQWLRASAPGVIDWDAYSDEDSNLAAVLYYRCGQLGGVERRVQARLFVSEIEDGVANIHALLFLFLGDRRLVGSTAEDEAFGYVSLSVAADGSIAWSTFRWEPDEFEEWSDFTRLEWPGEA